MVTLNTLTYYAKRCSKSVGLLMLVLLSACATTPNTPATSQSSEFNKSGQKADVFNLVAKADTAYNEGRWLEAEQAYLQLTSQVPDDYYAWFRLANVQLRQGRIDNAVVAYKQAAKRNPNQPKAFYNLATAHLFEALASLHQAKQRMRPGDPGLRVVAIRIHQLEQLIHQPLDETISTERVSQKVKVILPEPPLHKRLY